MKTLKQKLAEGIRRQAQYLLDARQDKPIDSDRTRQIDILQAILDADDDALTAPTGGLCETARVEGLPIHINDAMTIDRHRREQIVEYLGEIRSKSADAAYALTVITQGERYANRFLLATDDCLAKEYVAAWLRADVRVDGLLLEERDGIEEGSAS